MPLTCNWKGQQVIDFQTNRNLWEENYNEKMYFLSLQGGLRGVIWTDVFQTVVVLGGLIVIVVMVRLHM